MILLDRLGHRLIVRNPKDVFNKDPVRYATFQTRDNEGRVKGVPKRFEHSASWRDMPTGPGRWEDLEMKNGSSGGTTIKGNVYVGNEIFRRVFIKTTVDLTPSEIEAAYENGENEDDVMYVLNDAIGWASQEALDKALEDHHKKMENSEVVEA